MAAVNGVECGKDATSVEASDVSGLEDKEEFDDAANLLKSYCQQITGDEFEDQAASETEKALEELMEYLDSHKGYYKELLKKKKRQDLENGGLISFVKVKVMDIIHGENSPMVRVTEQECEKNMDNLKTNMAKVFDIALESKGRRVSSRLAEKRQKRNINPNSTPSRNMHNSPKRAGGKGKTGQMPPPPPPPPPPPMMLTPTRGTKVQSRKPFTPLQDRLNIQIETPQSKQKQGQSGLNDSMDSLAPIDCSLTSLHQELLSSNPWKRLKCVTEDKSPGGTPVAKRKLVKGTPGPGEPLYQALLNNIQDKFRNARSPSPDGKLYNNAVSPASALSPFE